MITMEKAVSDLGRQHPEWLPWLSVIRGVLEAVQDAEWDAAVPLANASRPGSPLLARAIVDLDRRAIGRLFVKLMQVAGRAGAPAMAGFHAVPALETRALRVFGAALNHDHDCLNAIAFEAGVDPDAFRAVAALLPVPFLHACSRRWASHMADGWAEGYCPVCGAWPAFAEVCGIERNRYLRCGSCGGAWQAHCLSCPYCNMTDHEELASLALDQSGSKLAIDVCKKCRGYLKVLTALQAGPAANVILDDLASAELDLAAAGRGYKRPPGSGRKLHVQLAEHGA